MLSPRGQQDAPMLRHPPVEYDFGNIEYNYIMLEWNDVKLFEV